MSQGKIKTMDGWGQPWTKMCGYKCPKFRGVFKVQFAPHEGITLFLISVKKWPISLPNAAPKKL